MKYKNKLIILLFISVILTTLFSSSCTKSSNSGGTTGTFYIHLHTDIDTNEVADTTVLYRDAMGRHFSLKTVQFFLSNIVLQNANGTTYSVANAVVLKDIDSEAYIIGNAPIGAYTSVSFNVGLDSSTNTKTPGFFNTNGYIPTSAMWYGTVTKGYNFMKLQGYADTTIMQTGVNPVSFSYLIGSEANLRKVTMPIRSANTAYKPYLLTANSIVYIHIICDYGNLLSVVNFNTQYSTDSYTLNPSIATKIANNIPNMFHYEE